MKKLILMIFFIFIVTFSHSQTWDSTRRTDLYKAVFVNIEVGYDYGIGKDSINSFVANIGILINPDNSFGVGIGTGVRHYPEQELTILPFYIDIRGYPFSYIKTWIPFVAVKLGHSFNLSDNFNPIGFMVTPSIGMMYENRNDKFYSLSINYNIQSIENPQPPNDSYNGIGLVFGYSF